MELNNTILGKQLQTTLKYITWLCLQRRMLVRQSPFNRLPWNEAPKHLQTQIRKGMHLEECPSSPAGAIQAAMIPCGQPKGLGEGLAQPSAASLGIFWVPGLLGTHTWSRSDWWHFCSQLRGHKEPHSELWEILYSKEIKRLPWPTLDMIQSKLSPARHMKSSDMH